MACVTPGRHPCLPACKCRTESTFPKAAEKTPECTFNLRADSTQLPRPVR